MIRFAVITHPDCLEHDTGLTHPENAQRLVHIIDALKNSEYADNIDIINADIGTDVQVLLVHTKGYLDYIKSAVPLANSHQRYVYLDPDTVLSPGSLNAALRAVGSGCQAVDMVMKGTYDSVFCAIRPPGHHATSDTPMGFCIFNNIAIAASYAMEKYNLERVAIVDFDVHHGNGTQEIFEQDERVLYISTHQSPLWPGTGAATPSDGHIVNIPLPEGTTGAVYRKAFTKTIIPSLQNHKPQLILVSAGFDSHKNDPLAGFNLIDRDFEWIGSQISAIANQYCDGKIVSFLEGGYDLNTLGSSFMSYIKPFVEYAILPEKLALKSGSQL